MLCEDKRCTVCYPNRLDEAAAERKRLEEKRQECVTIWRHYQKKAEAIVDVADPVVRNRRINAEYAKLWLNNREFQWAGLAAFASKQVGCGLLNAADMMSASDRQRDAYQKWSRTASPLEKMAPYHSPRVSMVVQTGGVSAKKVYDTLALGNTALFLDIWPLHMFYRDFGLKRLEECLPERQQLEGTV